MAVPHSALPVFADAHVQRQRSIAVWARPLCGLIAAGIPALLLFRQTAFSMLAIWSSSRTYSYCFVIVPLTAFLIWSRRLELSKAAPTTSPLGFALFLVSALSWLAGNIADVQLVQQIALIAMLDSLALTFLGKAVMRILLFPLAFLFSAVPVGDSLVPLLQRWTAAFTVSALRLSGIPAIQDGLILSTPSGNWQVAEACSGIRYLIASIVIGILMAGVAYKSWKRRIIFLLFSALLPVFANALRAYGIVSLAYISADSTAAWVDHVVYGFIFFSLITAVLLGVGLHWYEPRTTTVSPSAVSNRIPVSWGKVIATLVAAIMAAKFVTSTATFLWSRPSMVTARPPLLAPVGWERTDDFDQEWAPKLAPIESKTVESFVSDSQVVSVCFVQLLSKQRGVPLINAVNVTGASGAWAVLDSNVREVNTRTGPVQVSEYTLARGMQRRLVWLWYSVGDRRTANPYQLRAILAMDRLLGRPEGVALVAISTPFQGDASAAVRTLSDFLN